MRSLENTIKNIKRLWRKSIVFFLFPIFFLRLKTDLNNDLKQNFTSYYSNITHDTDVNSGWVIGRYNIDLAPEPATIDMRMNTPVYGFNNNLVFDFTGFNNYNNYLLYIYLNNGETLNIDLSTWGSPKLYSRTIGTSSGSVAKIQMRKKDLTSIPSSDVEAMNNVSIKLEYSPQEKILKRSLLGEYIENGDTTETNNDWIYTLGDLYTVKPEYEKIIMKIPSHGGNVTVYLTDMRFRCQFKQTYSLSNGLNTIEIDTSGLHCDMKINVYAHTKGALLQQNKSATNANGTNYSNAGPMTFYTAYSSSIGVGSIFNATYWSGNINGYQTYICVDLYADKYHDKNENITVSADGRGDFTSIMEAVRNCGDISHPCTITIKEGVYNEVVYLGNKHNVSLKGTSRDKCIIKTTTGRYSDSPVVVTGGFELNNLTLRAEYDGTWTPEYNNNVFLSYPGYALHIDGNSRDTSKHEIGRIINCTMYSEAFPAVGMGTNKNQNIIFDNCEMIRNCTVDILKQNNWKGAFLCHASNYADSANQILTLKNCIIHSNYGLSGNIRGELVGGQYMTIEAINNTCYSDETGFTFDYTVGSSTLSGISHGNTATNLNA